MKTEGKQKATTSAAKGKDDRANMAILTQVERPFWKMIVEVVVDGKTHSFNVERDAVSKRFYLKNPYGIDPTYARMDMLFWVIHRLADGRLEMTEEGIAGDPDAKNRKRRLRRSRP